MLSNFPATPGRGRSRFSKVLPIPPQENSATPIVDKSPALTPTFDLSPLPPLPKEAMASTMSIPRRPVPNPKREPSIASVSSIYSDSPALSRRLSDSSGYNTKDSLSGGDSEAGPTPPLPPKDEQSRDIRPKTANNILDSPIGFNHSPPRTEIWRRRSVKSERSIVISDLPLKKSNGSTASPPRKQEPPADRPLPRSITGRKPVPARPAPAQPEGMGNKLAKLETKFRKKSPTESSPNHEGPVQPYPAFQRLPTPEYLKADQKQPSSPQVVSPFTPPDETAPELPRKSESRSTTTTAVQPSMSLSIEPPNLLAVHSREPSETLTIVSEPQERRSPQPQKAFTARLLTPQPSPDKTSPPALRSPTNPLHFPSQQKRYPPGTIVAGPALDILHYECYQNHKFMRPTRNTQCPVGCMICTKKDTDTRWRCTWCCLSACGRCMQVLTSVPGKDLRLAMERIEGLKSR